MASLREFCGVDFMALVETDNIPRTREAAYDFALEVAQEIIGQKRTIILTDVETEKKTKKIGSFADELREETFKAYHGHSKFREFKREGLGEPIIWSILDDPVLAPYALEEFGFDEKDRKFVIDAYLDIINNSLLSFEQEGRLSCVVEFVNIKTESGVQEVPVINYLEFLREALSNGK
jgi:hypothetical protein